MNKKVDYKMYLAVGIAFIVGMCIGAMIGIDYTVHQIVTGIDGVLSSSTIEVKIDLNETTFADAIAKKLPIR